MALVATVLTACDRSAIHPGIDRLDLPRLIPAREFVFNQDRFGGFGFSPDGTRIAWTGPDGWRTALHVRSEVTGQTHVYRVGGSGRHWSADGRRMLILDDRSGAENHRLYRLEVDVADAEPVDLTPYPGVRVWLHQILPGDPEHVLVLHNRRVRELRDLYRINLTTGREEVVALNPGDGIAPVTDADGRFMGWRKAGSGGRARGKPLSPELRERSSIAHRTPDTVQRVGMAPDGRRGWVLSNRGRDRVALFEVDLSQPSRAVVLHEDPIVDVTRVGMSEAEGRPSFASYVADYPRTVVFDRGLARALEPLLEPYRGRRHGLDIVSASPDGRRLVVVVYTHGNRRYFLLDRTAGKHVLLGESRSARFEDDLVPPEAVAFDASDGLRLHGYLLRPRGAGERRLPLVVQVHGGPWLRVAWSDLDHSEDLLRAQFFANRGYAVLIVNFRGSAGYGRAHMSAAAGEFGKAMQKDLYDAVQWAVNAGIADPDRIAFWGHSYGGYASLTALAQHPTRFACGVSLAGPSDLPRLIETFPSYWELELGLWYGHVGDPAVAQDRERMLAVSPLRLADRIERPVLIMQGGTDARVPPEQSRRMVAALREHGRAVEYAEFPDMGHSTGYWAHHLAVLRRSEEFLSRCLGGRAARFDALEWVARFTGRLRS